MVKDARFQLRSSKSIKIKKETVGGKKFNQIESENRGKEGFTFCAILYGTLRRSRKPFSLSLRFRFFLANDIRIRSSTLQGSYGSRMD